MLFKENEQGRKEKKSKKGQNVRSSTHGINRRNEVEYTPDDARFLLTGGLPCYTTESLLSTAFSP
jgi:hypothetical protein